MRDKIFLIGYRATGKSRVGRELARLLGYPFRDLDEWVEELCGQNISEMVSQKGWGFFRTQERNALTRTLGQKNSMVVACGGGAVLHQEIWPAIRSKYPVVWLKAEVNTIIKRLLGDPVTDSRRPALKPGETLEDEIKTTLSEREHLYRSSSNLAVETDSLKPEEVARKILDAIGVNSAGK